MWGINRALSRKSEKNRLLDAINNAPFIPLFCLRFWEPLVLSLEKFAVFMSQLQDDAGYQSAIVRLFGVNGPAI